MASGGSNGDRLRHTLRCCGTVVQGNLNANRKELVKQLQAVTCPPTFKRKQVILLTCLTRRKGEKMNCSVVQEWLNVCSLKQQTVVLVALRGCDGVSKHDPSKFVVRFLRASVLRDADCESSFMALSADKAINDLSNDLDMYPMHWLIHFMHACEIVGYNHPLSETRAIFMDIYLRLVAGMHLNPETKNSLDKRLADITYNIS